MNPTLVAVCLTYRENMIAVIYGTHRSVLLKRISYQLVVDFHIMASHITNAMHCVNSPSLCMDLSAHDLYNGVCISVCSVSISASVPHTDRFATNTGGVFPTGNALQPELLSKAHKARGIKDTMMETLLHINVQSVFFKHMQIQCSYL
jgi:hypothetical protein